MDTTCPVYPTDLSDAEWKLLAALIPRVKPGGRPAPHSRREIVNAIFYGLRFGGSWRLLPHDLPPWKTVYHYWRIWRKEGRREKVLAKLRERSVAAVSASPHPVPGSWTHKASRPPKGGTHGYGGAKKVNGRKRYLLVDTTGTVMRAYVSAANVGDRDGAVVLLEGIQDQFARLRRVFADPAYRGQEFTDWIHHGTGVTIEIVQRADGGHRHTWAPVGAPPRVVPAFAVVRRRWVVERTYA